MFDRRRRMLRTAKVTLAAMLLSLLALTPFGLHARPALPHPNFDADFCGAAPHSVTDKTLPARPDTPPAPSSSCNDCAGCAGGFLVPVQSDPPSIAMTTATVGVVVAAAPAKTSTGGVVSRPRGPPVPA